MILAMHSIIIFSIGWFCFKKYGQEYPGIFWSGFLFRIFMGIALGLVYLYYYSANDTWLFFEDANAVAQIGKNDFSVYLRFLFTDDVSSNVLSQLVNSQHRSLFLIKIMSIFSWIGGNNYWVSAVWFSFISFLASWYLFSVVTRMFSNSELAASLSFLFFPSVAFWSSGLVKETLALAGIYFLAGLILKITQEQKVKWLEWIIAIGSFWVAWNLKYYWAALFGAVSFTYLIVVLFSRKFSLLQKQNHKIFTWLFIFIFLCGGVSLLHPNFHLDRFLEVLITNHNDFVKISDDDGLIHFNDFHASWGSVVLNSPWALFSGLFRPFIWEASGMTAVLAALENLVILILFMSALTGINRTVSQRLLLFSAVMYVALLCVFLALSTPNLGTLSRYRVGFLPFFIFVISYRNLLLTYLSGRIKFLQSQIAHFFTFASWKIR
jgi:hypothetical protein